ncbi:MAG: PilZ domain-containing protein [Candidatus Aquirickettsiella gammari]
MKKTTSDSRISEHPLVVHNQGDKSFREGAEALPFAPKQITNRFSRVEHRHHKRYLVKWRIAIVYEGGNGKKTFHGRVNEISMGGLSIHCDHNVFHEGKVILLLALPPLFVGVREKILEITCRMNYTILSKKLFRIGLEFVEFRSGERKLLEERLEISNAGGIAYSDG